MSEKSKGSWLEKKGEKGLRFLRDVNVVTAVGGAALGAAFAPAALMPAVEAFVAWNGAQAAAYEGGRRLLEKRAGSSPRTPLFTKKTGRGVMRAAVN